MQAPSAAELLAVWERARAQPMTTQALMLLEAASPGVSWEDLAKLSVGQRDARLLALREVLFGSRLTGLTSVPRAEQKLEDGFNSAAIKPVGNKTIFQLLSETSGGFLGRFRLPKGEDVT